MDGMDGQRRVDWEALGHSIGAITEREDGTRRELGGTSVGMQALERLLGEVFWRDAVDAYVLRYEVGMEVARSVLGVVQPWSGMLRCREIFDESVVIEDRRAAVELLRAFGDRRVLDWIPGWLSDEDEGVQSTAASLVDQLLRRSNVYPESCQAIRDSMKLQPNPAVRDTSIRIEEDIRREDAEGGP